MHSFTHRIAGAALLAAAAAPTVAQDVLVQAKRVVIAPGTVLEDSALLIRDGKVAYVGDDLLDLPVLRQVAFAATVPEARREVVAQAHFVTERSGGFGAARDVIEELLKARGVWQQVVDKAGRP